VEIIKVIRKTEKKMPDISAYIFFATGFPTSIVHRVVGSVSFPCELCALMRRDRPQLPQIFVGGRLVGDAVEVRLLHESGELLHEN
jgi:glutaredoxin domain-containing cysteine-rich protein 1